MVSPRHGPEEDGQGRQVPNADGQHDARGDAARGDAARGDAARGDAARGDAARGDDRPAEVTRLLRLAQAGDPEHALAQADARLAEGEGMGILYARAVALHCLGDHKAAAAAAELMLSRTAVGTLTDLATASSGTLPGGQRTGWRSVALSFRACEQMLQSEIDAESFDLESILLDLAQAEAALTADDVDGFVLATAHTGIGHGYLDLRLYELAQPHYEAAFATATSRPGEVAVETAVTSQLNLAEMHLNWSVELHRIDESALARGKGATAARHAATAQQYASTEATQVYAAHAALLAACADSSAGHGVRVVDRIRDGLRDLEGRERRDARAFALPFLARALYKAGQHREALDVAAQACQALPEDASWLLASAAHHARATLLARSGSDYARSGLAYGDQLAKTMWRQRLRTLHNARSMQYIERVTLERDRVQVLAHTDALTGVGNRRAFDARAEALRHVASEPTAAQVAVVVVDVDRLKAVNDAGGHEAGDRTLKAVAGALLTQVRPEDLVARMGGDEFVAVVEDVTREDAAGLATRIVDAVTTALGPTVTVSVGVATGAPADVGSIVLRAADEAMYAAKRAGGAATIV